MTYPDVIEDIKNADDRTSAVHYLVGVLTGVLNSPGPQSSEERVKDALVYIKAYKERWY